MKIAGQLLLRLFGRCLNIEKNMKTHQEHLGLSENMVPPNPLDHHIPYKFYKIYELFLLELPILRHTYAISCQVLCPSISPSLPTSGASGSASPSAAPDAPAEMAMPGRFRHFRSCFHSLSVTTSTDSTTSIKIIK